MKKYTIKEDILNLIYCGTYAPGEKLPSIRSVADSYGCSITPVVEAYNDLAAIHIIESRPCSGYYVSEDYEEHPLLLQHRKIDSNWIERYSLLNDVAAGYAGNVVFSYDDIRYPFGATSGCIDFYPVQRYYREVVNATRRTLARGVNYQVSIHDVAELKHEIMKWMTDVGNAVTISELTIFQSVSNALLVAIRTCSEPGDTIALEAPGFIGSFFIASFLNQRILPVPSDPETGLDVDRFEKMLKAGEHPACLVCSSTYVNPTGASMPEENKKRLVALCAEHEIPIIEDDITGSISFETARPRPLKCYDRENVIYISGFGKSLLPEVRLAWAAPGRFADKMALHKHQLVAYANLTLQYAQASFMKSGGAALAFKNFRRNLQKIMKEQTEIINECFPLDHPLVCPKGGIYLWVPLAKGIDTEVLAKKSAARGITIAPAETFHTPEGMNHYCRINCVAVPWDDDAKNALRELGRIATDYYEQIQQKNGGKRSDKTE